MAAPAVHRMVRLAALAVVGVLGCVSAPTSARADGCHVEERPVFGLDSRVLGQWGPDAGSPLIDLAAEVPAPNVRPRPCHGETPSAPGATPLPVPIPPAWRPAASVPARGPGSRLAERSTRLHPRHISHVPDRPPRLASRSA